MSSDPRLLSSLAAPTAGSGAKSTPAAPRPAPAASRPAASALAAAPRPAPAAPAPAAVSPATHGHSLRAAAIRARTWKTAWWLALRQPSLEVFEGLAANPSGSLERALRWTLAGAALGFAAPAVLSVARGLVPFTTILFSYGVLVLLLVGAFALATAAACAVAVHLSAYGLRLRPHLLERQPPSGSPAPATGAGLFQRAVYARLLFACAAFAAPLSLALGGALLLPGLLRALAVLGLAAWAVTLGIVAVRAACRVSPRWAIVAGLAGFVAALLPLAALAGAWWELTS